MTSLREIDSGRENDTQEASLNIHVNKDRGSTVKTTASSWNYAKKGKILMLQKLSLDEQ